MQSRSYKRYLLGILTLTLVLSCMDRVALGILLEDIKIDLELTDTQLGLLTGIAFTLFYSVMGVPIARWADRGNRITIISLAAGLWSAATALCGAAVSFMQLMLIRVGVAIGEAGCVPPSMSLIADYFDRAERPRAAAIHAMGVPLGALAGFLGAGWLNEMYGWRTTFVLLGIPGLLLAVIVRFTLREPRHVHDVATLRAPATTEPQPSMKQVLVTLWAYRTFRHLLLSASLMQFFGNGIVKWLPVYFIRSFGLSTGQIGTWLGLGVGVGGLVGAYLGGAWARRYAASNESRQLKAIMCAVGGAAFLSLLTYLSKDPYWAFGLCGLTFLGLLSVNGPVASTIQTLVPDRMRAVAFALMYLVANLIGMGLGPLAVGMLSDALHPLAGKESVRYALLILSPGYALVAWHLWRASRAVKTDLLRYCMSDPARSPERVLTIPDPRATAP